MDNLIPQHKRLAMGEDILDAGNFGVDSLASKAAGGPRPGTGDMPDKARGAAPPINGNQANPDHGDH